MWINDELEFRSLGSSNIGELPLLGNERVKTSEHPWNEIAAYQLANLLDLPVPRMRCFLVKKKLLLDGISLRIGSPLLMIEDIGIHGRKYSSVLKAPWNPLLKARFLAFCVFCGGSEYPEIHERDSRIYLLDLERIFVIVPPNDRDIESLLVDYKEMTEGVLRDCYDHAREGGFEDEFINALKQMIARVTVGFAIDLQVPASLSYVPQLIFDSILRRCASINSICAWME